MNLYDLVARGDRAIISNEDKISHSILATSVGKFKSVEIPAHSWIRITNAHEFSCLHIHSDDLGWSVGVKNLIPKILVEIIPAQPIKLNISVPIELMKRADDIFDIYLDWPNTMPGLDGYDIQITNLNVHSLRFLTGEVRDIRKYATPFLKGRGIEVGPGLRPAVFPSSEIEISYVEQVHPRDWSSLYNTNYQENPLPESSILDRYICDNASTLASIEDSSLDFIYSSHVFEHLHNPLMVLSCWLKKLRPGGFILANVPDARFTFDCRQPISTLMDVIDEEKVGDYQMPKYKYEQWARFTAPHQTAEQFMLRNYPIHAHYYTPDSMYEMLYFFRDRGGKSINIYMHSLKNNKDFFIAIKKLS